MVARPRRWRASFFAPREQGDLMAVLGPISWRVCECSQIWEGSTKKMTFADLPTLANPLARPPQAFKNVQKSPQFLLSYLCVGGTAPSACWGPPPTAPCEVLMRLQLVAPMKVFAIRNFTWLIVNLHLMVLVFLCLFRKTDNGTEKFAVFLPGK